MASTQHFIDHIVSQCENAGHIAFRKMFGEYAVYCDGKVVALVCDDQLFIKPTQPGREFIGKVVEAPPYPGASLYFLIEDRYEDREWFSRLVRITADALPLPKPKNRRKILKNPQ